MIQIHNDILINSANIHHSKSKVNSLVIYFLKKRLYININNLNKYDMDNELIEILELHPHLKIEDRQTEIVIEAQNAYIKKINAEFFENHSKIADIREWINVYTWASSMHIRLYEQVNMLGVKLASVNHKIHVKQRSELEGLVKNQFNYKSKDEKEVMINGEKQIALLIQLKEILETYVTFYSERAKAVTSMIYLLKTRVDLEKELNPVR